MRYGYLKGRVFKNIERVAWGDHTTFRYVGDSSKGLPWFEDTACPGVYHSHEKWRDLFYSIDGIPFPPDGEEVVEYKQYKHLRVVK